jgi:hypothetical protein
MDENTLFSIPSPLLSPFSTSSLIPPFLKGDRGGLPISFYNLLLRRAFREELLLKNLPLPLFTKEGHHFSLWKREGRRDLTTG